MTEPPTILSLDFETRSDCSIDLGPHRYIWDPSTDLYCLAWAFDDDAPQLWWPYTSTPFPAHLRDHVKGGGIVRSWNVAFERVVWNRFIFKHPALRIHPRQTRCTQAEALAASLSAKLGECGQILGLPPELLKHSEEGNRLVTTICSPNVTKEGKPRKKPVVVTEQNLVDLGNYCIQDVVAERALAKMLPRLPPIELDLFHRNMIANERGIRIDTDSVRAVVELVEHITPILLARLRNLTGDPSIHFRFYAALGRWLSARLGTPIASVSVDALEALKADLGSDIPDDIAQVLELWRFGAKSSTAKFDGFAAHGELWPYVKDSLRYHYANTGRFAGTSKLNVQNMARSPKGFSQPETHALIKGHTPEQLVEIKPATAWPSIISHAGRGVILPEPGHLFWRADYSGIEMRGALWLAGDVEALKTIHQSDIDPDAPDAYQIQGATIFGRPAKSITGEDRQVAKSVVLGAGFLLGAKRLHQQLADYGTPISMELAERSIKAWRQSHPKLSDSRIGLWGELERGAIKCVRDRVETTAGPHLRFVLERHGSRWWLAMILPNGKRIRYFDPIYDPDHYNQALDKAMPAISFAGFVNDRAKPGRSRIWSRHQLSRPLLIENATQAVCRELMVLAARRISMLGYTVPFTVSDEIIAEIPDDGRPELHQRRLDAIMLLVPIWMAGMPIGIESEILERYAK